MFRDPALPARALTHRSAAPEHNERLEFLGDTVLDLVMSELLYRDSEASEGEMTRARAALVNNCRLAGLGRQHGLGQRLRLGRGEAAKTTVQDSILAGAVEALFGAIYLDAGLPACRRAARLLYGEAVFGRPIPGPGSEGGAAPEKNAKSRLQERLQAVGMPLPSYQLLEVSGAGPDCRHHVACQVRLDGRTWRGVGLERGRRAAEQLAAEEVLRLMEAAS